MSNAIVAAIQEALPAHEASIRAMLGGSNAKYEKFVTSVLKVAVDPALSSCTPGSILNASLKCAEWGLLPINGHVWILPRFNSRANKLEAVAQLGVKGISVLLGRVNIMVESVLVKEKDTFELINDGNGLRVRHTIYPGRRGAAIGAYATFRHNGNLVSTHYSNIDEIEAAMLESKSYVLDAKGALVPAPKKSGPWLTHPEEMMRRVPILRGWKYLPIEDDGVASAMLHTEYAEHADLHETRTTASPAPQIAAPAIPSIPAGEPPAAIPPPSDPLKDARKKAMNAVAKFVKALDKSVVGMVGDAFRGAESLEEIVWAQERLQAASVFADDIQAGRLDAKDVVGRFLACKNQYQVKDATVFFIDAIGTPHK